MIDSYSFGSIVINGKKYNSDVVVFRDFVNPDWWRKEGHKLRVEDIEDIVQHKPKILIIGTGYSGVLTVLPETKEYIESLGIRLVIRRTEEACNEFNKFVETQDVIAALHLTC